MANFPPTLRSSQIVRDARYQPPEVVGKLIPRLAKAMIADGKLPENQRSPEFRRNLKWFAKMGKNYPEIQNNGRLQILFAKLGAERPHSR